MKVFVIYDITKYDRSLLVDEFIAEGYTHRFTFSGDVSLSQRVDKLIDEANEVWIFGDVDNMQEFKLALYQGKDIWVMG